VLEQGLYCRIRVRRSDGSTSYIAVWSRWLLSCRVGQRVETATIGRGGVIGATAGLGANGAFARAIMQLPGRAAWLSTHRFYAAANQVWLFVICSYANPAVGRVQCASSFRGQACSVALANARLRRRRRDSADAGVSRADARRTANHCDLCGSRAAKCRHDPLSPRPH
jgi:hypothetical protein